MWICDEDRFNWYCDIPPDPEPANSAPEAKVLSEEVEAVAALKALREGAERKRALAIIKPTPENLTRAAATAQATATAWGRVATTRRTTACARSISGPKNSASAKRWRWK
ncbi:MULTISPECIES: conjugal transfer protein TraF [Candidatus Accumulibacter]|nr:conjugal transfer protein TraF [Candidatus Accumulibacter phosphatis]